FLEDERAAKEKVATAKLRVREALDSQTSVRRQRAATPADADPREDLAHRKAQLETIRAHKLAELRRAGVEETYLVDLIRMPLDEQ
ncbi:hypothetical protein KIPB_004009, partial [Kipferlia bialata]